MSKTLGTEYHLHSVPGDPNLQKKLKRLMTLLKIHSYKLTQGTQDSWLKILPIPLMRAQTVPQKWYYLNDRPFLCTEIIIDP